MNRPVFRPTGPRTKGAAIIGGAEQHSAGPGTVRDGVRYARGQQGGGPLGRGDRHHRPHHARRARRPHRLCGAGDGRLPRHRREVARPAVVRADAGYAPQVLRAGVERDRIKAAPGFDKEHWPTMANSQWATTIHEYYGISPYWEKDRLRSVGLNPRPDENRRPRAPVFSLGEGVGPCG